MSNPFPWDPATNEQARALASLMKSTRKRLGVTQEELARAIGCDRTTVPRIEQGRLLPSFRTQAKILRALGYHAAGASEVPPFAREPDLRDRHDVNEVVEILLELEPSSVAVILALLRAHRDATAASAAETPAGAHRDVHVEVEDKDKGKDKDEGDDRDPDEEDERAAHDAERRGAHSTTCAPGSGFADAPTATFHARSRRSRGD